MSKKRSRVDMMTAGAGYESDSGSDSSGEAAQELVAAGLVKPGIVSGRGQYDKVGGTCTRLTLWLRRACGGCL